MLADQWRAMLEAVDAPDVRETQRGQALFRRGAVRDFVVASGVASGVVVEGNDVLDARVEWEPVDASTLGALVSSVRAQARYAAALVSRELPVELLEAFRDAGVPLVPARSDLVVVCACPGWCRHGVAVIAACVALFERDPFEVLTLRGIDHDILLQQLRASTVSATGIAAPFDVTVALDRSRGDIEALALHPAPPRDPAGLLAHLGPPPGVQSLDTLAEIVAEAADAAWRLAAGDGAAAADVEALLAELRGQQVATVSSLARALGSDGDAVAAQLEQLYAAGEVMRTGTGADAKYRAARR